jgi:hypothetical protein
MYVAGLRGIIMLQEKLTESEVNDAAQSLDLIKDSNARKDVLAQPMFFDILKLLFEPSWTLPERLRTSLVEVSSQQVVCGHP